MFHFLLYVTKRLSNLNIREAAEQFEPNFNPCKVNLTHTLGAPLGHSQATVGFTFRFMDRDTFPDYRALTSSLIVIV